MSDLERIVRALDAVEAGDDDLAGALLAEVAGELDERAPRPHVCGACRRSFRFPGELDDHELSGLCWRAPRGT
jgi:hypothetical protein